MEKNEKIKLNVHIPSPCIWSIIHYRACVSSWFCF